MQSIQWAQERPTTKRLSYEVVGPVVHRWLLGLHQYISFHDDGSTQFLYCARAGVRIKRLLDIYYRHRQIASSAPGELFWISRISVCKGTFGVVQDEVSQTIAQEFWNAPISELVRSLLRNAPEVIKSVDFDHASLKAHGKNFPGWIRTNLPGAAEVRRYLSQCSEALSTYLRVSLGEKKRVLLIDSGWQGTSQKLLTSAFPAIEWRGAYIGRMLQPGHSSNILHDVVGILFEADRYDPLQPATAITAHRHLFETILEPNAPSVEELLCGPYETAAKAAITKNLNEHIDDELDQIYLAVESYIAEYATLPLAEILSRYEDAIGRLAQLLTTPTREEATALVCKDRSADFGRTHSVPVLLPVEGATNTSEDRIQKAIWTQGQIALEHPDPVMRLDLQRRSLSLNDNAVYFDPLTAQTAMGPDSRSGIIPSALNRRPLVAIVTRTKNRPLLLQRAAQSVLCQTYPDYHWVVVNDGGSTQAVLDVINTSAVDRRKIHLVNHKTSKGMEAASNAGIGSFQSDYIVIHDDDDSLHATFLEKGINFLESPQGKRYGGVVTGVMYVSEEIKGDHVVEHERKPYHDWVKNIHFAEMARGNLFPPIAFLFRREVYTAIGGYNESLPVLGDWFFNLEFLLKADIGVITEPLAFYHHRDRGTSNSVGAYANSVIGGVSKHEEFASVARNEFIRRYAHNNAAVSAIIAGYFQSETRHMLAGMNRRAGATAPFDDHAGGMRPEEYDRLWAILQYNKRVRGVGGIVRKIASPFARVRPLSETASWEQINRACARLGFKPSPPGNFDSDAYLTQNPDVKKDVISGKMHSAYHHYLVFGRVEGRSRPFTSEERR